MRFAKYFDLFCYVRWCLQSFRSSIFIKIHCLRGKLMQMQKNIYILIIVNYKYLCILNDWNVDLLSNKIQKWNKAMDKWKSYYTTLVNIEIFCHGTAELEIVKLYVRAFYFVFIFVLQLKQANKLYEVSQHFGNNKLNIEHR